MIRLETKAALTVDDAGTITGLAWPFNAGPDTLGDTIRPGAFRIAMPIDDLGILIDHDAEKCVGEWTEVQESERGLEVKGQLFIEESRHARVTRSLIRSGQLGSLSIGFEAIDAVRPAPGRREIRKLDLYEISLCKRGKHPGARVLSAKSADEQTRIVQALDRAIQALRS